MAILALTLVKNSSLDSDRDLGGGYWRLQLAYSWHNWWRHRMGNRRSNIRLCPNNIAGQIAHVLIFLLLSTKHRATIGVRLSTVGTIFGVIAIFRPIARTPRLCYCVMKEGS